MSKFHQSFRRLFGAAPLRLAIAMAAMLLCDHAQAQNSITISNSSISSLQNALISGITNIYLQFNDTVETITPLEIVEDTVLDATGFNVTISGSNVSQIFFVDPGVNFTVINVSLSGGNNIGTAGAVGVNGGNGGSTGGAGGAGGNGTNSLGGAVYNQGNSTFIGCLFLTNAVVGGAGGVGGIGGNGNNTGGNGGNGGSGGVGYGGAIYNMGTLLLSNCTVAGNTAIGGTGGAGGTNGNGNGFASYPGAGGAGGTNAGAGIYNLGKATIINTTINQNACLGSAANQSAGGAPNSGNGNGAAGPAGSPSLGGGICNFGTNTLLNCTFFANTAVGGTAGNGGTGLQKGGNGGNGGNAIGGGLYNGPGGIIALTNCTFSGGAVTGGTNGVAGPGGFVGANGSPGAALGANIANANTGTSTFLFRNSILDFPTNATSAYGTIVDQGNNISSDPTPVFTTTNSFNNKDPKLSVTGLAANGSSTVLTIGLSANSPAINAIYDGSAPSYDERGFVRPGQIRPDIGAYEFASSFTTYNVVGLVTIGGNPFPGITVNAGTASTVTGSNGVFQFSLPSNNLVSIHPNPQAYFNPQSKSVLVTSNVTGLIFNASNAVGTITNVGNTNTNIYNLSFTGIPNFNYRIQAATNLVPSVTWSNLATNNSGASGIIAFTFPLTGTNALTNFPNRYFRAITP